MLTWTPPKGTTLYISVKLPSTVPPSAPKGPLGALRKVLGSSPSPAHPQSFDSIPLMNSLSGTHSFTRIHSATVSLESPQLESLLKTLETDVARGLRIEICRFIEPPCTPSPDHWYRMKPCQRRFFKPSGMRPSQHCATNYESRLLVSEHFLEAVQEHKLTGLDWLPLTEFPDRDPLTWFQVFATHFVGRGLDHPLHDRERWDKKAAVDRYTSVDRCMGETNVWPLHVRKDVPLAVPALERLRHVGGIADLSVIGAPRLVREFLPRTDFAYRSHSYGPEVRVQHEGRVRELVCNQRAREVLLAAQVMRRDDFVPWQVVPESSVDVEVLDRRQLNTPLPTFTPSEAAAERSRREAIRSVTPAAPASLRFVSWDKAKAYLNSRLESGNATWTPMSAESAQEALADPAARRCPKAWQVLLPLIPERFNDDSIDGGLEFECGPPNDLDWHPYDESKDPDGPLEGDVVIAWSPNGDWFAIRPTDPTMPEEAAVTWWDHETLRPHQEWPSICSFVAELIEVSDKIAGRSGSQEA